MTKNACLAIAMFVILVATVLTQNAPSQATGTVQGIVTREGTNDPIPDAEIQIPVKGPSSMSVDQARSLVEYVGSGNSIPPEAIQQARDTLAKAAQGIMPPKPTPPLRAVADASGRFTISNVPVGDTSVTAQLSGYFGSASDGSSPQVSIRRVVVTAQKAAEVHLSLIPGGSISGRVTDSNGKPVSDAMVRVFRQSYSSGLARLESAPGGKTTDDRGEFRLYRLPPGEYLLAVLARPNARTISRVEEAGGPIEVPRLTMYPGVTDPSRAIPLVLKGGEDMTGVNLQAMTSPGFKIAGKVSSSLPPAVLTGARGAVRAPVATVSIVSHDTNTASSAPPYPSISASPEGTFEFSGIPPGVYDLIARMPAGYGWGSQNPPERATGAWAFGRTTVEVRNANIEAVIVVSGGVDIPGRVMVDGQPASPSLSLRLIPDDSASLAFDEQTGNTFGQISQYTAKIADDGSFKFPVLPEGRYRIQASLLPKTAFLADVRQGSVSVYDNGLVVGTQAANPLEVSINTRGGTFNGKVVGMDRIPTGTDITAVLVPSEERRQNTELYFIAHTNTENKGRFAFSNLPPGSYKLFAWASVKPGAYQNAEFLRRYEHQGVPVTILASSVVNAEVEFIP